MKLWRWMTVLIGVLALMGVLILAGCGETVTCEHMIKALAQLDVMSSDIAKLEQALSDPSRYPGEQVSAMREDLRGLRADYEKQANDYNAKRPNVEPSCEDLPTRYDIPKWTSK